ncbi:MAG: amidohydrolase family protein, partial [Planctomycetota bacterium]
SARDLTSRREGDICNFLKLVRLRHSRGSTETMIVDCFTHVWDSPAQVGLDSSASRSRLRFALFADQKEEVPTATPRQHFEACAPVDRALVLGFKSHYLGAEVSNDMVAAYVREHPEKLIGFAGIDPTRPKEAVAELRRARDELDMRGIVIAPAAQDFHPAHSTAHRLYEVAAELELPVLFHPGLDFGAQTKLEYAQPTLLDEVAREHPTLKIIIAHMGYPWVQETLVMLGKHPLVYSDISWLLHQPWQAYLALSSAYQYGVIDKLLFGSGFPFTSAAHTMEALYSINHMCHGTHLPTIPREQLRGIVERNTLELLSIRTNHETHPRLSHRALPEDD